MKTEMGLHVNVFRWTLGDCTNRGISASHDTFTLIGAGRVFTPSDSSPALYTCRWYGRLIACPVDLEKLHPRKPDTRDDCSIDHLGGWMCGGNFIYSSDDRFPSDAPIHIYDRRED